MTAVTPLQRVLAIGQAAGGLESLGLKAGQTVTAKVLDLLPGGLVRIAIAGQELSVSTQALLRPGSEVVLRAEREGQLLKLLLQDDGAAKPAAPPAPSAGSPRPALSPAVNDLVRLAHAQLLRELSSQAPATQAGSTTVERPQQNAAAVLERFLQLTAPAGGQPSPSTSPPLTPQQRTVLASIANGFAEIASGGGNVLPDVLRQTAARLLSLAPHAPNTATQSALTALPQQATVAAREAVGVLFSSLAQLVGQDDAMPLATLRNAAARLLDVPAVVPRGVSELQSPEIEKAALARLGAVFDTASRLQAATPSLPQPVRQALALLFGLRLSPGDTTTPAGLQQGLKASGLLHETLLAQARPGAAPLPDMKGALLLLRTHLVDWTGGRAQAGATARAAQPPSTAFLREAAEVQSLARTLLQQVESHLARLRLGQLAATPDRHDAGQGARTDPPELAGQISIADGARTPLLQFQIEREAAPPEGEERRAWSVRFAFDFDATGFTQGLVVLRGSKVRVRMRAERRETFALFSANETLLRAMLEEAELEVDDISLSLVAARPEAGEMPHQVDEWT